MPSLPPPPFSDRTAFFLRYQKKCGHPLFLRHSFGGDLVTAALLSDARFSFYPEAGCFFFFFFPDGFSPAENHDTAFPPSLQDRGLPMTAPLFFRRTDVVFSQEKVRVFPFFGEQSPPFSSIIKGGFILFSVGPSRTVLFPPPYPQCPSTKEEGVPSPLPSSLPRPPFFLKNSTGFPSSEVLGGIRGPPLLLVSKCLLRRPGQRSFFFFFPGRKDRPFFFFRSGLGDSPGRKLPLRSLSFCPRSLLFS